MVYVFGTVCLDRVHNVNSFPSPGGYVEIDDSQEYLGGEAFNTAKALVAWGHDVTLIGNRLDDKSLTSKLHEEAISTIISFEQAGPMPVCDIYVTPNGQRTMFGRGFRELPGLAQPELLPHDPGAWVTVDTNVGAAVEDLVVGARHKKMHAYVEDYMSDTLERCDMWQSSTDWYGTPGDLAVNQEVVRSFASKLGCYCILTDGPFGVVTGGQDPLGHKWPVQSFPAFPAHPLVDTTGAGDALRAGMLHGLTQSWPMLESLRFACATASLTCGWAGASSNVPTRNEIETLICKYPEVSCHYE